MFHAIFGVFKEDPGFFIGLAFVIVATYFLPARVRWYVFSAGIGVVIFRAYQLFWARGRIKELDNEREQLQGQLKDLRSRNTELEKVYKQLTAQLKQLKLERDDLIKQRNALDESSANYAAEKQRLDTQLEKNKTEADKRRAETKPVVDFLKSFADTDRIAANVPEKI
jgi:septal ring factor EnvC (AmiA/AmiB activator)